MRVYFNQRDEFGIGWYRCRFPMLHCFNALANSGIYVASYNDLKNNEFQYDAYVFHRTPSDDILNFAKHLKQMGKKIVWQCDDALFNIPKDYPTNETNHSALVMAMDL